MDTAFNAEDGVCLELLHVYDVYLFYNSIQLNIDEF